MSWLSPSFSSFPLRKSHAPPSFRRERLQNHRFTGAAPWLIGVLTFSGFAWSQEAELPPLPESEVEETAPPADTERSPSAVLPPEPKQLVLPEYPESELHSGKQLEVGLELLVASDGTVSEIKVQESQGEAFDQAALAAVQKMEFHPAQYEGKPVAVRILFRVHFEPPEGEAEESIAPVPSEPVSSATGEGETNASEKQPEKAFSQEEELEVGASEEPQEILVRGHSLSKKLERSAYAVQVVEMEEERRFTGDLGEVLTRRTPVMVQRSGGLGSRGAYSLGGLGGDRVRFLLNGIPLEYSGYITGIANVPLTLVDRVEVYQGVVPVRFGSDALGGAVHLVSDEDVRSHRAGISYQAGSFDTHRVALHGRYFHEPSGVFVRLSGFFDSTENNYPIDVQVPSSTGKLSPARVHRFHDGYRGAGANLAVGVVDKPWADRLVLQVFHSQYDQDVQNNAIMAVPYGEVDFHRNSQGGNVRYTKRITDDIRLDVTGGYSRIYSSFLDVSDCRYDWFGQCFLKMPARGEVRGHPIDQYLKTDVGFLRSELSFALHENHDLRVSLAPTYSARAGENREIASAVDDPLRIPRNLFSTLIGVEHESRFLKDKLQNILFFKGYYFKTQNEQVLGTGERVDLSLESFDPGFGDSLRYLFTDELYGKLSYEYATRLPTVDEIFGDGLLTLHNLGLQPERSHNVNLGVFVEDWQTDWGIWKASANGFFRYADDLIVLLNSGDYLQYKNVSRARILGVEVAAGWAARSDWIGLDARLVYQDVRNRSEQGDFALFLGDRLPNAPYLQSNANLYLRKKQLFSEADMLEFAYRPRYVGKFFRGWESAGSDDMERLTIPTQFTHNLAVNYSTASEDFRWVSSIEVHNLTNEQVFDFYGVQRPGRAIYAKMALDY